MYTLLIHQQMPCGFELLLGRKTQRGPLLELGRGRRDPLPACSGGKGVITPRSGREEGEGKSAAGLTYPGSPPRGRATQIRRQS